MKPFQGIGSTSELMDAEARRVLPNPRTRPERPTEIPGIDMEETRRMYGPEQGYLPHYFTCTFRVAKDIAIRHYEQLRDGAIKKWLGVMNSKGYDLVTSGPGRPIIVRPAMSPAFDIVSGVYLLGTVEVRARAAFVMRHPKVVTIELPPELLKPTKVAH